MGRYVSGDFDYKYVVARQGSNLGEILSILVSDSESYVNRYTGDDGEVIYLWVEDGSQLRKPFEEFIDNFDVSSDASKWNEGEWNRYMIQTLVNDLDLYSVTEHKFEFFSEY